MQLLFNLPPPASAQWTPCLTLSPALWRRRWGTQSPTTVAPLWPGGRRQWPLPGRQPPKWRRRCAIVRRCAGTNTCVVNDPFKVHVSVEGHSLHHHYHYIFIVAVVIIIFFIVVIIIKIFIIIIIVIVVFDSFVVIVIIIINITITTTTAISS